MCLKPLVNNNQRFPIKDFNLTQTLLDNYGTWLLKEYVSDLDKGTKWHWINDKLDEVDIVGAQGLHMPRNLAFWEDCESIYRWKRNSTDFWIQRATRLVQRQAVTLTLGFPQLSSAPEGHWNKLNWRTKYSKSEKQLLSYILYVPTCSSKQLLFIFPSSKTFCKYEF